MILYNCFPLKFVHIYGSVLHSTSYKLIVNKFLYVNINTQPLLPKLVNGLTIDNICKQLSKATSHAKTTPHDIDSTAIAATCTNASNTDTTHNSSIASDTSGSPTNNTVATTATNNTPIISATIITRTNNNSNLSTTNTTGSATTPTPVNNDNNSHNNTHNNDEQNDENDDSNNNFDGSYLYQNNYTEVDATNIKIVGLNVCGLRSKLRNGIFDEFAKHYDILCLSETKTDRFDLKGSSLDNEYSSFIKEKSVNTHRFGGVHGLCMLVKNNIASHAQLLTDIQSPYILWVKFRKEAFGIECIIGSVYLPVDTGDYADNNWFEAIQNDVWNLKINYNVPICLIGDFNSRTGTMDDVFAIEKSIINTCEIGDFAQELFDINDSDTLCEKRHNKDIGTNLNGETLINLCLVTNMRILNGRLGSDKGIGDLTYRHTTGNSTIDYCIVTPNLIPHIHNFEVDVLDRGLSDCHSPIILTLNTNHRITNVNVNETPVSDIDYDPVSTKWCDDKKLDFQAKFDPNKIVEATLLLDTLEANNPNQANMDDIVKLVSDISIKAGIDTGISKQIKINNKSPRPKKQNKPWFDQDCHLKRKQYIRFKNRLRKSKSPQDEETFKTQTKSYKKYLSIKRHMFNKNLHTKLRNLKSSKPKEYWNLLNPKKKNCNNDIGIESLHDHFKGINDVVNQEHADFNANNISVEGDYDLNKDFSLTEIKKLINKLKNNKSCGIDNIINEFIKSSPNDYKLLIVKLFNIVLKTGIIPSAWSISFISPIYKNKGSKSDPDNYRGISLISCLGKLFTSAINERLTTFVELNKVIGEEQAGFRSGYSTQDHIFTLHSIIDIYLNKFSTTKRLYCAFIDYQKAFDLVDRSSLWSKLLTYNINGRLMKLIHNLYKDTKACIKLNNKISNSFSCNIGVRQGDSLSPLLFSLFINDFEEFLSNKYNGLTGINNLFANVALNDEFEALLKLYILLYADDTIIMAENPNNLQMALNAVGNYCEQWKLKINISKTKIIRFAKRRQLNQNDLYDFRLNGERVELVDNYVYLGTTISYNGQYSEAIKKQVTQAQRALFAISSQKEMYDLPFDIVLDLFDKMILPILLYGCEIWGYSNNIECIEVFYRKFLKYTLRLNKQTTNCMVYGETGRKPLSITIKSKMICFWHKITVGADNKLSYKLSYLLKKLHEQNRHSSPWLKFIEDTLNTSGLGHVWLNPGAVKYNWLKKAIELRLSDLYTHKWHEDINTMSSCLTYRSIKPYIKREKYLMLPNGSDRINLCKFRCRNIKIPVVALGYAYLNIDYENRICSICSLNVIGDEYHYILECPALQTHRSRYISEFYMRNPNMDKFVLLFQSENVTTLTKLAKFVFEINKIFR